MSMDNYLDTGGVLPSGLLSGNDGAEKIAAFNKTYKNYPLRLGIITQIYISTDPKNFSKLSTEYDVLVFEQNEDRGNTILTYKNCIASDSLGSIADFLDVNFRKLTQNTNPGGTINTSNQNGATVLLLCLDGVSEKAVILGGLNHPDRPTTLIDAEPRLTSEYNGVNIAIQPDGSTALTWKGPTDNNGDPIDEELTPTTVNIASDGSFSVGHSAATFSMAKDGTVTVTANGAVNVTAQGAASITAQGAASITTQADATITASGNTVIEGAAIKLGAAASESVVLGDMFKTYMDQHFHSTGVGPSGPPVSPMPPSTLSTKVKTE